ncbi:MAG: DUF2793 domain-containing protein [Hyphomicrobiaceae bacterium]
MTDSPNLGLPYLEAGQAQKHVTHNEALRRLDAILQATVSDRTLTTPPASPADGECFIASAGANGAWLGHDLEIATWQDGAWAFHVPQTGWRVWSVPESALLAWTGTDWTVAGGVSLVNPAEHVGVNATADATNRLSVSSPATLLSHEGAGHQLKINKSSASETASLLYQTDFSGRAEMGTAGDDDFHVKVSADGATWHEAIVVDRTTGEVSFPNTTIGGGVSDGDKGDITVSGSGSTWTVDGNAITNAKLAEVATATLKGRATAGTGDPEDLTGTQATALLDTFTSAAKGLAPASGGGSTNFLRADGTWAAPPGAGGGEANTASNVGTTGVGVFKQKTGVNLEFKKVNAGSSKITITDDTGNSEIDIDIAEANLTLANLGGSIDLGGAKASGTLAAARFPALTGDVTTTAGALGTSIADNAVQNAKLGDMATATIKGRVTAGTGDPEDLTGTQATTLLDPFTSALKGLAPASGGGTTNFLRADGAWAAPPSGGGEPNTASNVNVGGVGVFKQKSGVDLEFRGINAVSSRITVGLDSVNNEIDLDINEANLTLGNIGGSIDLSGSKVSGTLAAARFPALTGDVTTTAGALTATIPNNTVTNAKAADMATATLKGRATAGSGDPEDLTAAQARTILNVADGANAYVHPNHSGDVTSVGDGATTIANDAVTYAKMQNVAANAVLARAAATSGDVGEVALAASQILGRGTTGDIAAITLGTNLSMSGTTLNAAGGGGLSDGDYGDITVGGTGTTMTIDTGVVSNAKLANVATATLKGRVTAGTGAPEDLTGTQATALLDAFTSGAKGLAPASGGGTTNFLRADGTWAAPAGGGGGSPGGSDTQIQYNDGGVFNGSADFTFNETTGQVAFGKHAFLADQSSAPAVPTGGVSIFTRKVANRRLPAYIGPAGIDSVLQPFLGRNKIGYWAPGGNNSAAVSTIGLAASSETGTRTARSVATTNMFTRMRRLGIVSAATAGSLCGSRYTGVQFTTGTGDGILGGFFMTARFGISDVSIPAGPRMFMGMRASGSAPTNVEPSTLTNCIGMGHGASDTNFKLYISGSVAQTPIDLGSDFPNNTSSVDVYELALFCPPGEEGVVYYEVTRLNTNPPIVVTGSVTPSTVGQETPHPTTALLTWNCFRTNNATATAVGIDIMHFYIETDQ